MTNDRPRDDPPESSEITQWEGPSPTTRAPDPIGPYRLLTKVGEGGVGEVWLAEQQEPVRRQVAVKIIKPGMDSTEVVARFEIERQALAMMDHPAIAKVHDAGTTRDGRPYFVMEYVRGVPITEHCSRHRLSVRDRLSLFLEVCEGVQYAHQKAVIHRDLKPTNVLVAIDGDTATPKIIDFGVAKATAQQLTERPMYTEIGVLIGTPEYMSPEQAAMTGQDIDTRTDVYALGVMLYELLTGELPFEGRSLRAGGFEGLRRQILDQEPQRPSTRLARSDRAAGDGLWRALAGDLDWITLRALEKDRTRRYGSPAELAADIRRYLEDLPVTARPPSTGYRVRKFVRRHRTGVLVATVGLAALVAFATSVGWLIARVAEETRRANLEETAKGDMLRLVNELLEIADPGEARSRSVTKLQLLEVVAPQVDEVLRDQPQVRASLLATIGRAYDQNGAYQQAGHILEEAHTTQRHLWGEADPRTLETAGWLALALRHRGERESAERLFKQTLAIQSRVFGTDSVEALITEDYLGTLYYEWRRWEESEAHLRTAVDGLTRRLGRRDPRTLRSMNNLALYCKAQKEWSEAQQLLEETSTAMQDLLGEDHWETLSTLNNLADLYREQGRYDEAESIFREVLRIQTRVLGESHPKRGVTMHNLAHLLVAAGRPREAIPLFEQVQPIFEAGYSRDHPHCAENLRQHAAALRLVGETERALRLEARAASIPQASQ